MIGQYNLFFRFPDRQHTKRNFSQKWSSNTICGRFSIKISFLSKKHILSHMHFFLRTMHVKFLKKYVFGPGNPLISYLIGHGPIFFKFLVFAWCVLEFQKFWSLFIPDRNFGSIYLKNIWPFSDAVLAVLILVLALILPAPDKVIPWLTSFGSWIPDCDDIFKGWVIFSGIRLPWIYHP